MPINCQAIDTETLQRLEAYKSRQKTNQVAELEQDAAAIRAGDLDAAQRHLAASNSVAGSGSSAAAIQSTLSWGYSDHDVYVPAANKTELKERGLLFKDYYWETTQTSYSRTISSPETVYFSVRLKNPSSRIVRVTYKITAREKFSVGKTVGNVAKAGIVGFFARVLVGSVTGDMDKADQAGVVAADAALGSQAGDKQWFNKEKTFTATLAPGEEAYETGTFPVSMRLAEDPSLEIVRVD